jgi:ketosteroid isomerase-like protein
MRQVRTRLIVAVMFLVAFLVASGGLAQTKKAEKTASGAPDKAHLQKIWDAWSTLDPANASQFYAQGPHAFFDIAPLKYASWDEYQKGAVAVLADFKTAKLTVNDDAEIHPAGSIVWATATVKEDATMKSGKREMGNFRWTVVFAKEGGKWLIVHEHISVPMS